MVIPENNFHSQRGVRFLWEKQYSWDSQLARISLSNLFANSLESFRENPFVIFIGEQSVLERIKIIIIIIIAIIRSFDKLCKYKL